MPVPDDSGFTLISDPVIGGAAYVNWSADDVADVPTEVTTVTSTGPAGPAGLVAVIWVAELTTTLLAGVPPKFTTVAPVRSLPVMITCVPPPVKPVAGLMLVTTG